MSGGAVFALWILSLPPAIPQVRKMASLLPLNVEFLWTITVEHRSRWVPGVPVQCWDISHLFH